MKRLAIVLACCALVAACGKSAPGASEDSPAAKGTVTVFMYSEYIDPALVERFQKETGLKVVLDTYENTEEMMSKVSSAGDQYDVVVVSDLAIPSWRPREHSACWTWARSPTRRT